MFGESVALTGMDIYARSFSPDLDAYPFVGKVVTIRLWSDANGLPASLLTQFNEVIDIVDLDHVGTTVLPPGFGHVARAHASFSTPIGLAANTQYWIGMSSGDGIELGQHGLFGPLHPDDNTMAAFDGLNFFRLTFDTGDMAFRLEGNFGPVDPILPPTANVVPEPASLALWSLMSVAGLAVWRRRQRANVV